MVIAKATKYIFAILFASIIAFYVATLMIPASTLVVLVNGLFAGAITGIIVAYGKLVFNALFEGHQYDRVRQMALGMFGLWLAYGLAALTSIYFRVVDIPTTSTYFTAAHRWLATLAAIAQVTAPDLGEGLLHGRDRKILWPALIVGFLVALAVVYMQDQTLLTENVVP